MKKITLLLASLLILVGCSSKAPIANDASLKINSNDQYTYTLGDEDKEYIYNFYTVEMDEQSLIAFGFNPDFTTKEEITTLAKQNFYRVNEISTSDKDDIYRYTLEALGLYDASGDDKYLVAAQKMIWETQVDTPIVFNIDLATHISDIKAAIENANRHVVNFNGSVITISPEDVEAQRQFTLTDRNGLLPLFEVVTDPNLEIVSIEEDTLSVKLIGYQDDLSISFIRQTNLNSPTTYEFNDSKDNRFLTLGSDRLSGIAQKFHFEMNDSLVGTTLNIVNIDQDNINTILFGGQYELADDIDFTKNVIQSSVSTNGVHARFENVTTGKLYLRQISAPEGYTVSDEVKLIEVTDSSTKVMVTYANQLTPVEVIEE